MEDVGRVTFYDGFVDLPSGDIPFVADGLRPDREANSVEVLLTLVKVLMVLGGLYIILRWGT